MGRPNLILKCYRINVCQSQQEVSLTFSNADFLVDMAYRYNENFERRMIDSFTHEGNKVFLLYRIFELRYI